MKHVYPMNKNVQKNKNKVSYHTKIWFNLYSNKVQNIYLKKRKLFKTCILKTNHEFKMSQILESSLILKKYTTKKYS